MATLVRCPPEMLQRLRNLHESEIITLYTPFIPHAPSTRLPKDMDPFEPLGRALPRRVRHVPYRMDHGVTEMHTDFLPTSGAVIVVICVTHNVLQYNAQASEQQVAFARAMSKSMAESAGLTSVPIVTLLVEDDSSKQAYVNTILDFPVLVAINDYTTPALSAAVRVLFAI